MYPHFSGRILVYAYDLGIIVNRSLHSKISGLEDKLYDQPTFHHELENIKHCSLYFKQNLGTQEMDAHEVSFITTGSSKKIDFLLREHSLIHKSKVTSN